MLPRFILLGILWQATCSPIRDFSPIFAFIKSARTVSLYNYIVTLECSQPAKLPARQSHVVRAEGKVNIKMFMFLFALAKTNDLLVSY